METYLLIVTHLITWRVCDKKYIETTAWNLQLVSAHYAVWCKCVLLVTLDYLKMGLAHHLSFCHDLVFSPRLHLFNTAYT